MFGADVVEMFAIEKVGWRHTRISSSTSRPEARATLPRSLTSSSVWGRTASSGHQLSYTELELTEPGDVDALSVREMREQLDEIEHRLSDQTAFDTIVRILRLALDHEVGVHDTAHTIDDARVLLIYPRRVGEEHDVDVSNAVLVLPDRVRETPRPSLLLAFDDHDEVDVKLPPLLQSRRRTRNGEHGAFVVAHPAAIQVTVAAIQLPRVALPVLLARGLHIIVPIVEDALTRRRAVPSLEGRQNQRILPRIAREHLGACAELPQNLVQQVRTLPAALAVRLVRHSGDRDKLG